MGSLGFEPRSQGPKPWILPSYTTTPKELLAVFFIIFPNKDTDGFFVESSFKDVQWFLSRNFPLLGEPLEHSIIVCVLNILLWGRL